MEEIKVGEYGRTNKGNIFIFAWLENSDGKRYTNKVLLGNGKIFENKFYYFDDGEEIVKHSKNIIDLIEEGDYINGKYVYSIGTAVGNLPIVNHTDGTFTPNNMIKSIVTKEQFSNIEYRLED